MVKIIESKKLEIYLISLVIISSGFTFLDFSFSESPLAALSMVVLLYYLLRLFVSFRNWKFSKGISVINALLNFQIIACFNAIPYNFLNWPGRYEVTYVAINGTLYVIFIIGIFLLIKWEKINKTTYWEYLKANAFRVLTGTLICVILFYAYEMPSYLND